MKEDEVQRMMHAFQVKLTGPMEEGAGGMKRSTADGKVNYALVLDGVMFRRWAEHLTKATLPPPLGPGYDPHNWMKALEEPDAGKRRTVVERAKESAVRHLYQWFTGDKSEDHAAAVLFNINVAETVGATL